MLVVDLASLILFFLVVDIYAVDVVDKEMSANLRATLKYNEAQSIRKTYE